MYPTKGAHVSDKSDRGWIWGERLDRKDKREAPRPPASRSVLCVIYLALAQDVSPLVLVP
jgi:hypothetical protein